MKKIPEKEVKSRFAQIIGEGNLPKDWGGEKSDLFTSRIRYNGKYTTAAFLLKGPAKFKEMKCSDLGKNGDQIDRLFNEPAQICILQHCHKISTAVRSQMKAYACRMYDLRNFCIIDGYDTLNIFAAYDLLPEMSA